MCVCFKARREFILRVYEEEAKNNRSKAEESTFLIKRVQQQQQQTHQHHSSLSSKLEEDAERTQDKIDGINPLLLFWLLRHILMLDLPTESWNSLFPCVPFNPFYDGRWLSRGREVAHASRNSFPIQFRWWKTRSDRSLSWKNKSMALDWRRTAWQGFSPSSTLDELLRKESRFISSTATCTLDLSRQEEHRRRIL